MPFLKQRNRNDIGYAQSRRDVDSVASPIESYGSDTSYATSVATESTSVYEEAAMSMSDESDSSENTFESDGEESTGDPVDRFSHFERLMKSKESKKNNEKPTTRGKSLERLLRRKKTDNEKVTYVDRLMKKHDRGIDIDESRDDDGKFTQTPDSKSTTKQKLPKINRLLSPRRGCNTLKSDPEDIERDHAEIRTGVISEDSAASKALNKILRRKQKETTHEMDRNVSHDAPRDEFIYKNMEGDELSFMTSYSVYDDDIASFVEDISSDEDDESIVPQKKKKGFLLRKGKGKINRKLSDESSYEDETSYDEESVFNEEEELSVAIRENALQDDKGKKPNPLAALLKRSGIQRAQDSTGEGNERSLDEDSHTIDESTHNGEHSDAETFTGPSVTATVSELTDNEPEVMLEPVVVERKVVKKEVTVKSIGNVKRSQYILNGRPSVPYQLTSISPLLLNKEPVSRSRTTPRYHVQSPRNGQVFQRIKPRPVLMDVTRGKSRTPRSHQMNEIADSSMAVPSNDTNPLPSQLRPLTPKSRRLGSLKFRKSTSRSRSPFRTYGLVSIEEEKQRGIEDLGTSNAYTGTSGGDDDIVVSEEEVKGENKDPSSTSFTEKYVGGYLCDATQRNDATQGNDATPASASADSMDVQLEAEDVGVFGDENVPVNEINKNEQMHVRILSKAWRKTKEERPEIDEREHIDNIEVAYNEPKSSSKSHSKFLGKRSKRRPISENIGDHINVIVETEKIDKSGKLIETSFEEKPRVNKGIFKDKIKKFQEKISKKMGSHEKKFELDLENLSSDEITRGSQRSHVDFCRALKKELVLDSHGHLENSKIMYQGIGGESTEMMAIAKENGDLVPAPDSSKVLIQIEASTVSKTDANIRHGHINIPFGGTLPVTPGIDFVGRVRGCGENASIRYGINEDDRVASLCGCGGNAKYIAMEASNLVRVPLSVPATSATIVVESYLPAFQALHAGMNDLEARHSPSSLKDSAILIFGGITSVGQAMIELALLFGASKVYSTGLVKHHDLLESLGAIPLGVDQNEWLPPVRDQIDVVVDPYSTEPTDQLRQAIKTGGKIVCFGVDKGEEKALDGWFSRLFVAEEEKCENEFNFDVFDEWENNLERSKSDLSYLFGLLKTDKIEPQVARTLKLSKVPDAHFYLDGRRRVQGTFVCVPWAVRQP